VCGRSSKLANKRTGEVIYMLGVFDGKLDTLVHELGHITLYVLDHVGIPVGPGDTSEAFCYLQGDLFTKTQGVL
jgi:hypothetical protein